MQFNIFDSSQYRHTQNHPNNPQNHHGEITKIHAIKQHKLPHDKESTL